MTAAQAAYQLPLRVYYADTDAGGVVYHATYLHFFERCRTEMLRARGISQQQLRDSTGCIFVIGKVELVYLGSARLDDELIITADIESMGAAKAEYVQHVWRGDTLLTIAKVRVVCVDINTGRPTAIPDHVAQALQAPAALTSPN